MKGDENSPLVAVVIASYNFGHLIAETIDSVLAQTYRPIDVIVADGGSTDDTGEVVDSYGPPVRRLHLPGMRVSPSRNAAIRSTDATYVAFVDADDLWHPSKIQKQVERMQADPSLGLVYCDTEMFDGLSRASLGKVSDRSRMYEGHILQQLYLNNFIASASPLVRRDVFNIVGSFNEDISKGEDWDLWLRIASRYPIAFVPEPLARVRIHLDSLHGREDLNVVFEQMTNTLRRVAANNRPTISYWMRQHGIANVSAMVGRRRLIRSDVGGATKMFALSIAQYPFEVRSYFFLAAAILSTVLRADCVVRATRGRHQQLFGRN